jgi:hypothetical protein
LNRSSAVGMTALLYAMYAPAAASPTTTPNGPPRAPAAPIDWSDENKLPATTFPIVLCQSAARLPGARLMENPVSDEIVTRCYSTGSESDDCETLECEPGPCRNENGSDNIILCIPSLEHWLYIWSLYVSVIWNPFSKRHRAVAGETHRLPQHTE